MRRNFPAFYLLTSLCLMGGLEAGLSITARSPFLPPGKTFETSPEQPESRELPTIYEFNGVYSLHGRVFANIRNTRENWTAWFQIDENKKGLTLSSFDSNANTCVLVTESGQSINLALRNAPEPAGTLVRAFTGPSHPGKRSAGSTVKSRIANSKAVARSREVTRRFPTPGPVRRHDPVNQFAESANALRNDIMVAARNPDMAPSGDLRGSNNNEPDQQRPANANARYRGPSLNLPDQAP